MNDSSPLATVLLSTTLTAPSSGGVEPLLGARSPGQSHRRAVRPQPAQIHNLQAGMVY